MEYSAWYAMAKGEYFFWYLALVVMVLALCRAHYQRAWRDVLGQDEKSAKPGEEGKKTDA